MPTIDRLSSPPPLAAWEAALRDASAEPADIVFLGDSISQGFGATSRSAWWVDVVRRQLQASWGGTSGGYRPASVGFWRGDPGGWTISATTDLMTGLGLRSQVLDAPTDELRTTISGSTFRMLHRVGPDHGVIELAIDDTVIARIDAAAAVADGGRAWTSPDLGSGPHELRIRAAATGGVASGAVVVEGVLDGDTPTGVRTWDAAHGGYGSNHFVEQRGWQPSMAEADPELVVIELGTNDVSEGTSSAEFTTNLRSIVGAVRSAADGPVSIALMPMYPDERRRAAWDGRLVEAQRRLAAELGLAVVDLSALDPRAITVDGIHPNDSGQTAIAAAVLETIDPRYDAPGSVSWPMRPSYATGTAAAVAGRDRPVSGFRDVPAGSAQAPAVTWAAGQGITAGCTADRFCPARPVTRAQIATFLWRMEGQPQASGSQFSDVAPGAYYADAVRWVRDRGITSGCTVTTFCPNASATRAQVVTFLWRHAGAPAAPGRPGFSDVPTGAYYEDAVTWARDRGITTGTSPSEFSPDLAVTRGQTAVFLHRANHDDSGSLSLADPTVVMASHTPATGSVEVGWSVPAGSVTHYTVIAYDRTAGGVATHLTTAANDALVHGLMPGRSYVFGVHAHGPAGVSPGASSNAVTLE